MLSGEYQHSIDTKGRLTIPAEFREALGEEFVVTRGSDECLQIFPLEAWEEMAATLNALPRSRDARDYIRHIAGGAKTVTTDKLGRVLLPQPLRDYAGLGKDVVLEGVLDRIEIWDKALWDRRSEDVAGRIEDIAESLTGQGFNI